MYAAAAARVGSGAIAQCASAGCLVVSEILPSARGLAPLKYFSVGLSIATRPFNLSTLVLEVSRPRRPQRAFSD